jgi:hypothetical protein
MAEYAGYVASAPVNYGEITNGLVSNIIAIDQAKREQDRKTQLDFDKYYNQNTKAIKDFELSKSQSFNDMIGVIGDGSKQVLQDAYRTGSKQAVNRVTANLKTSINNINAASKSINENFGIIKGATLKGEVSPIGNTYADFYTDAMNFKDGSLMVLPDGTIPYVKYDKDGKIISQNSFFDPATLTDPAPFLDRNVDYEKDLNTWASELGDFTDEKGRITTTSPLLNPAFKKAKETKITDLTSTPRNSARFLSSIAGYRGYKSEDDKKELLSDGIPEDKLIKVELVNGIPQPILTDGQNKAAKLIAEQQIDQRVGIKKTEDEERQNPMDYFDTWQRKEEFKASAKEAKDMAPKMKAVQTADAIFYALRTSGEPGKMGPIPEFSPLKQAAQMKGLGKISVSNVGGEVIISGVPKGAKMSAEPRELARLSSPGEVYAYLTGKENIADAKSDYDLTKDYMQSNQPTQPKSVKKSVSLSSIKAMSSQQRGGLSPEDYAQALKQNYPDIEID